MADDISRSSKLDALDLQRQCKVRSGWSSCCDFWGVDIRGPIYLDPARTRPVFPLLQCRFKWPGYTNLESWQVERRDKGHWISATRLDSIDWWFPILPSSSKEIDVSRRFEPFRVSPTIKPFNLDRIRYKDIISSFAALDDTDFRESVLERQRFPYNIPNLFETIFNLELVLNNRRNRYLIRYCAIR